MRPSAAISGVHVDTPVIDAWEEAGAVTAPRGLLGRRPESASVRSASGVDMEELGAGVRLAPRHVW